MESRCEVCGMRQRAESKPNSLLARLWRWHTTWCPGWKEYQAELAKLQAEAGAEGSTTV
jgi:hypothetical protein